MASWFRRSLRGWGRTPECVYPRLRAAALPGQIECFRSLLTARACVAIVVLGLTCHASAQAPAPQAGGDAQITRTAGTIKSAQADSLTLIPDSGGEVTAN